MDVLPMMGVQSHWMHVSWVVLAAGRRLKKNNIQINGDILRIYGIHTQYTRTHIYCMHIYIHIESTLLFAMEHRIVMDWTRVDLLSD